jgi:hypothetical protein
MKISQICAFALLLVVGSVMAFADGINDPKIIIRGVNGGSTPLNCHQGCTNITGLNFNFTAPKGSGTLFFTNKSGKNWTSLTLIETKVPASAVSCAQTLFLNCTVSKYGANGAEIVLSGIKGGLNPRKGILNNQSFAISFVCSKGCWPGGVGFQGQAGTVPEPGTVAFMVTGLGAIMSRRKMWSRLKT